MKFTGTINTDEIVYHSKDRLKEIIRETMAEELPFNIEIKFGDDDKLFSEEMLELLIALLETQIQQYKFMYKVGGSVYYSIIRRLEEAKKVLEELRK